MVAIFDCPIPIRRRVFRPCCWTLKIGVAVGSLGIFIWIASVQTAAFMTWWRRAWLRIMWHLRYQKLCTWALLFIPSSHHALLYGSRVYCLQASELNAVVSEVFNTAFLYKTCRPGLSHVTAAPPRIQQPTQINSPHRARPTPDRLEKARELRLSAATVTSRSPSDGYVSEEIDCSNGVPPTTTIGGGLGSISSITESVNSWSFKIPASPNSEESAAVEERIACQPLLTETQRRFTKDADFVSLLVLDIRWRMFINISGILNSFCTNIAARHFELRRS